MDRKNRMVVTDSAGCSKMTKRQLNATLLAACTVRDLRVAAEAIKYGADVNCKRPDFMTPLHVAAEHGDDEMVRLLRSVHGLKPETKTMHGLTPLHTAALLGNRKVIYELLKAGAYIDCKDNLGREPLHYAALQNNLEFAKFLISAGACIHVYDVFHESPLYISALKTKNLPMTKLLACYKLRRSPFTPKDSQPLLLEVVLGARDTHDLTIVKTILQGAGDIVNIPDPIGWRTPLHVVAMTGYQELAEYLIDIGADVHAKNRDGQTPLQVALNCKNFNIIRLIEKQLTVIEDQQSKINIATGLIEDQQSKVNTVERSIEGQLSKLNIAEGSIEDQLSKMNIAERSIENQLSKMNISERQQQ